MTIKFDQAEIDVADASFSLVTTDSATLPSSVSLCLLILTI
jgi:hypothetical protein